MEHAKNRKPIRSVLIANRGEVAVRVAGTLKSMGIRSIIVYTDADRGAPFTRVGDTAVPIGGDRNYINIDVIVKAALASGADGIHPGYGFLAESAPFAEAVTKAGIQFIGPNARTIARLGSKIGAKQILAVDAPQVPLIPGFYPKTKEDSNLTPEQMKAKADQIGYPVLVKAAAGGGGKGMRVVRDTNDFLAALDSAKTEARMAFGDEAVLLERYFEGVRHIEVQIIGDSYGNVDHLGERECSVQRRHQKLLEESPSPALDEQARAIICGAAVTVGKSVAYEGAGTVEFIVEQGTNGADVKFYFLEVNTRLQVEHAVTEQCKGVDIVKMQVMLASGAQLGLAAADCSRRPFTNTGSNTSGVTSSPLAGVQSKGFSIEARVYAEDDSFMPCVGTVTGWRVSTGTAFYHCATEVGSQLGVTYDGLICKVIVYAAESREAARLKLVTALKELVCFGVYTNRRALINLLNDNRVVSGDMTTDMIDKGIITQQSLTTYLPRSLPGNWNPVSNPQVLIRRAALIAEEVMSFNAGAKRKQWGAVPGRWSNNAHSAVTTVQRVFTPLPQGSNPGQPWRIQTERANNAAAAAIQIHTLPTKNKEGDLETALVTEESGTKITVQPTAAGEGLEFDVLVRESGAAAGSLEPTERVAVQIDRNPSSCQPQVATLATGGGEIAAVVHVQFLESGNQVSLGLHHRLPGSVPVTTPTLGDDALPASYSGSSGAGGPGEVKSPIPAKVVKVVAGNGTSVKKGDVVVVLESMKMERKMIAPCDGKVSVSIKAGEMVAAGSTIFKVTE